MYLYNIKYHTKTEFLIPAASAKSLQSCPTLCDPIDSSPSGSLSLGFSRQEHRSGLPFPSPMHESEKSKWSRSVVSDFATPWTAAYQAPLSMGFSRQEYWSGVPLPSPSVVLNTCKYSATITNIHLLNFLHLKTLYLLKINPHTPLPHSFSQLPSYFLFLWFWLLWCLI